MKVLFSLLKKSYPLEENRKKQIQLSFIFGAIIFLVLFIFQPFGNSDTVVLFKYKIGAKIIYSLLGGLITAIVLCFDFIFFFAIFPSYFTEEKWTVGREIIWTLIIITTIATANFLVNVVFFHTRLSFFSWLNMVLYTAIIGIVPATVSILLNQA
jgi:hypothetical protein